MCKTRWRHGVLGFAMLLLALLGAACRQEPVQMVHEAYIWQRLWNPAVVDAVHQATPAIGQWRVLAAQAHSERGLYQVAPDWAALTASGKSVVAVVRIDGHLGMADAALWAGQIADVWQTWHNASTLVVGLEIDYDCGTQRLGEYTQFLRLLRSKLPPDATLSITALPDWLNSADLVELLSAVDTSVLQVHAVSSLQQGLFNADDALKWVQAYSLQTPHPFMVALPNYGSRVTWDEKDNVVAVTSEAPSHVLSQHARELLVEPQQMAEFIATLQSKAVPHLKGIVWFRLPTAQDRRAWSLNTWLAVVRGDALQTDVHAFLLPSPQQPGLYQVMLENKGEVDAPLPLKVLLPAECLYADGLTGYSLASETGAMRLVRQHPGMLRAQQTREIGWARCSEVRVLQLGVEK
ncbi:DUF3142 domain-containing protein [Saezia sanguinis]|uniref:DUF3142 domain-containing protein n=1 Tax=Saezia sanguinis TaxID=1965230 RepID=UPI0030DB3738